MNRRQFLVVLSGAAAAQGVTSSNLPAQEAVAARSTVMSLRNGSSRLDLVPGPDGYGLTPPSS
jgi:hypothetical protein